ncbi:TPA: type 1 fimbrial protein [Pseudomonas putida]|nr:type 1 fimbrial protein [Pseudomonas putida]
MNKKLFSLGTGLFFGLTGMCFATTSMAQSTVNFSGSVVESSCTPSFNAGGLRLVDCPALARGSAISVSSVEPVRSVSALDHSSVHVKLVADSGNQGSYYNQQYVLVNDFGKRVSSGAYLITVTSL